MRVAVIGAGWAGVSAALQACKDGHHVTIFEAARTPGGRARALSVPVPSALYVPTPEPQANSLSTQPQATWLLDNGQHILIGAYSHTLALMQTLGIDPDQALLRLPLTLLYPDGTGLRCPDLSGRTRRWLGMQGAAQLEIAWGLCRLPWSWADKWALLRRALRWQQAGFVCDPGTTVAQICQGLPQRAMREFIEPLCVSALNTEATQACAQVFLRVLQDALTGAAPAPSKQGAANKPSKGFSPGHLLLPRTDLGALLPQPALRAMKDAGAVLHMGQRATVQHHAQGWQVISTAAPEGEVFDAVILATSASDAASVLAGADQGAPKSVAISLQDWLNTTRALHHTAIATVYACSPGTRLHQPMLALHSSAAFPAQFVFDRGWLHGDQAGLLAFVVSASQGDRRTLQEQVLAQAQAQLGLHLLPVITVVEKRATFACTPALQRPGAQIAPGLLACGDYTQGPYPATLEGSVRSGLRAAALLG